MIRQALALICILGVMPLCTGMIYTGLSRRADGSPLYAYLSGLLTLLGVFQAMAVPMSYRHTSLKLLCLCFLGAGAVLSAAGILIVLIRRRMGVIGQWFGKTLPGRFTPLLALVILCILLQMVFVTKEQHIDEDDAFYLGTAVTSVQDDSLYKRNPYTGKTYKGEPEARYVLASWPLFIAMLSKVSGMHAVKLAHMVLPAVVLMWCYLVYFLLAGWLYPDRPDQASRFMLFIVLLHTFAGYSIYNAQVFVMIRSWQGKAVLCGVGLPALTYFCLRAMAGRMDGNHFWTTQWTVLTACVAAMTCFTTIGSIFAIIITGSFGLYHAIVSFRGKKGWRCALRWMVCCALSCLPALVFCGIYLLKRG